MENNFKYFNFFFIMIISIILIGLFKYFFYESEEKNTLKNSKKKYLNKNYIDHILFIPDNYYFLKSKKIEGLNNEYPILIIKLFTIIAEALKYNNLNMISMNLLSITDISLMNNEEMNQFINNKKLWKLIEKYAKKNNIEINFIYDKKIIDEKLIFIFDTIKKNTSNKKYKNKINFIVGYDLFNDIRNTFINLIKNSKNKNDLLIKLNNINIQETFLNQIPNIDLVVVFDNAQINDNLLLHMKNAQILYLNYSLEKITKKHITLILKEYLLNINPFL